MNKIDLKKLINKAISNEGFLSMPSFLMNDILTSIVDCITEYKTALPDDSTDNPNIDAPSVDVPVDIKLEVLSNEFTPVTTAGDFMLSFKTNYKWKIFTTNSEWLTVDKSKGNINGINADVNYQIKYSLSALPEYFNGSREASIIIVSGDKYAIYNVKQVSANNILVPEGDSIIGTYTQRWGIKALQTYGPDNWGTDAAITAFEGEKLSISPIFGSTGFNTGGLLEKVDYNLYRLDGGVHNLLGTTSPVYFKVEHTLYLEDYHLSVGGVILKAYSDAECTSSYIQLNNGNYITDYILIKNA